MRSKASVILVAIRSSTAPIKRSVRWNLQGRTHLAPGTPAQSLERSSLSSCGKSMPTKRRGTAGSPAAELRPPGRWLYRNPLHFLPECDAPLREVVGGHLDGDAVTAEHPDMRFLHSARGISQDLMPVVEPDTKSAVRKHIEDIALKLDQFFLVHAGPLPSARRGGHLLARGDAADFDPDQSVGCSYQFYPVTLTATASRPFLPSVISIATRRPSARLVIPV